MTKKYLLIVSMCLGALSANAQSYIEHVQTEENGKGRITINESARLDSIVNNISPVVVAQEEATHDESAEGATASANTGTATAHAGTAAKTATKTAAGAKANTTAATTKSRKDSGVNHVIKSGETVNVYSIQVFSGGNSREDKAKAQSIAAQVNARFPGSGARASFHSPRWVVVTGAYASQEIATANLKRMKAMGFTQASIFRRSVVKK